MQNHRLIRQIGNFVCPSNEQANYESNDQRNNNPYSNTTHLLKLHLEGGE